MSCRVQALVSLTDTVIAALLCYTCMTAAASKDQEVAVLT
jgi:hypothetical protein